jgi:hypothetical protein
MTVESSRSLHAGLAASLLVAAAIAAAPVLSGQAPSGQAPSGQASADNTLTAAEQAAGWQLLFDGTTIDKWRAVNGTGVPETWAVVDATITAKPGKGTDLVSVEEYGDFELAVDFKVARNGNSGIFYRGVESPSAPLYHSAPEYQVLDDVGHPDAKNGPDRFCGANYDVDPPLAADACRPAGEWNSAKIIAKGAHVEHWLNGKKTADYELWSPEWKAKVAASKFKAWPGYGMAKNGRFALQHHGDEVAFKNIKVRALK